LAQGGLVVFHCQLVVRSVFHHQLPRGFILGVERIQSHRAPRQIQLAEECARHRDLIGFGVDQGAAQVKLAGHAYGGEDGVTRAVAGFLAIHGNQFIGGRFSTHLRLDSQQHLIEPAGVQSGQ
jgi:hypothetical protein